MRVNLLEIYTTPFCGFCARVKNLLTNKNINSQKQMLAVIEKEEKVMKE